MEVSAFLDIIDGRVTLIDLLQMEELVASRDVGVEVLVSEREREAERVRANWIVAGRSVVRSSGMT